MSEHRGQCLCGAVVYSVTAPPQRITVCHCRFCQRATGGPYLIEPIFAREDWQVLEGQPKVHNHRSAGSGKVIHVHFCADCGTKIAYSFERFPDAVGVLSGTFDDPAWFDGSTPHMRHIFTGVARPGTIIPPGVDTYVEHVAAADGSPNAPVVFDAFHEIPHR